MLEALCLHTAQSLAWSRSCFFCTLKQVTVNENWREKEERSPPPPFYFEHFLLPIENIFSICTNKMNNPSKLFFVFLFCFCRRFGRKETFADMLAMCSHCCSIFWQVGCTLTWMNNSEISTHTRMHTCMYHAHTHTHSLLYFSGVAENNKKLLYIYIYIIYITQGWWKLFLCWRSTGKLLCQYFSAVVSSAFVFLVPPTK